MAPTVKSRAAVWETLVLSLGWEDPLEKGMATHSSSLAWRIPQMEEPCGLQPMGSQSQTLIIDANPLQGFPGNSEVKNPPANAGDVGLIPGS